MSFEEFLKLPFEIQMVLAAGYIGYRVSATGLDRNHKAMDLLFIVLTFGLVAYTAYDLSLRELDTAPAMAVGIVATIIAASIWRRWGRAIFVKILRSSRTTRENFVPSSWDHIIQSHHKWGYVSVTCDDDVAYESDLLSLPGGLPFEPLDIDSDGNIALYVTRIVNAKNETNNLGVSGAVDEHGRAHLTYIPSNRIKHITISLDAGKVTLPVSSAAEVAAEQQA